MFQIDEYIYHISAQVQYLPIDNSSIMNDKPNQYNFDQMGLFYSRQRQLNIATLNYSGITLSPYEFVTDQSIQLMAHLNYIFRILYDKIVAQKRKDLKNWQISDIDTAMQRLRYSPLYRRDAGIKDRSNFLTRKQFQDRWKSQFQKNQVFVNFKKPIDEECKNRCMLFDFIMYKTLVEYSFIYNPQNPTLQLSAYQAEITDLDRIVNYKDRKKPLRQFLQLQDTNFRQPYLNEQKKVQNILEIFIRNDVVFLQDVSEQLINSLKSKSQINIITSKDRKCAILIKQKQFKQLYDQKQIFKLYQSSKQQEQVRAKLKCLQYQKFLYNRITEQELQIIYQEESKNGQSSKKQPKTQKNTAVCFVDDYLLISLHLSSKKEYHKYQCKYFVQHMKQIHRNWPNLHIIVGGDFNTQIINTDDTSKSYIQDLRDIFSCYPDSTIYTTKKKRTFMQAQLGKALGSDIKCRDFLLFTNNIKLKSSSVYPKLIKQANEEKSVSNLSQDQITKIVVQELQKAQQKTKSNTKYLPAQDHPFDHSIVNVKIVKASP